MLSQMLLKDIPPPMSYVMVVTLVTVARKRQETGVSGYSHHGGRDDHAGRGAVITHVIAAT